MRKTSLFIMAAVVGMAHTSSFGPQPAWAVKLRPVEIKDTIGKTSGATVDKSDVRESRKIAFRNIKLFRDKSKVGKSYKESVGVGDVQATPEATKANAELQKILDVNGDDDAHLKDKLKSLLEARMGGAPLSGVQQERFNAMTKKIDDLDPNTPDSNRKFASFYNILTKSDLLVQRDTNTGKGTKERLVPRRSYDSPEGRMLQLGKHISSMLYYHADEGRQAFAKKNKQPVETISEVQTMFVGDDIYVATNSPQGADVLADMIKNRPDGLGLLGLLGDLPPSFVAREADGDLGRDIKFDKQTRIERFRNKLTQLANGTRRGGLANASHFDDAANVMDNIKRLDRNDVQIVTVDFDGWTDRVNNPRPDVTGAEEPEKGKRRLFLVKNLAKTYDKPVHAETGLVHVLSAIRGEQDDDTIIDETPAVLAGKKRACGSCFGELIAGKNLNLIHSLNSGKIWSNQTAAHDRRTNLITAYMTLASPSHETVEEPEDDVGPRKDIGSDEFDDDSESRDDVERKPRSSSSSSSSSSSTAKSTGKRKSSSAGASDVDVKPTSVKKARKRVAGRL
jgi:hypothetical protein